MEKLTAMYAALAYDAQEKGERIAGFMGPVGWVPMVISGADPALLDKLKSMAQAVADKSGQPVTVVKFTSREDVLKLMPQPKKGIH